MWQTLVPAIAAPIALFAAICWLLRLIFMRISGWGALRAKYGSGPPESGWTIRGESATAGPIRFRRIVRAAPSPEGLYLAVGGLAPLPPIRIPWGAFERASHALFYRHPVIELAIAGAAARLQVSPALFDSFRLWLPAGVTLQGTAG